MSVLYIALPVAILLGGTALVACIRAIRGGQFEDLDSPAMRMLIEPSPAEPDGDGATKSDQRSDHRSDAFQRKQDVDEI